MTDILKLSELTTVIARGISPKYTEGDGVMVLNQRCVRDQTISYENHRRNDVALRNVSSQKSLKPFDILVNSTGVGTLGRVAQIKTLSEPIITVDSHVTIVRPDPERISPRFLGFSVRGNQKIIEEMAEGATGQTELSRTRLGELMIYVPLLPTQKKIASILSAYDDLIENNNRRIQILEEMAQRIYREWFVHFRFPGHENVKMVDSELGRIPEGWEVAKVTDLARLLSGFSFKSNTYVENGRYGVVTIKNVHDGSFSPITDNQINEIPDSMPEHCHLETGDIIISLTGNVGRVCMVHGESLLLNQRVAKIVPITGLPVSYIYYAFRDSRFQQYLENIATGTAQANLSPVETGKVSLINPPGELLKNYGMLMEPLITSIFRLTQQTETLRKTRDLLLPRLISGRLDVENLDIAG